jgi:hypothetical protein
MTRNFDLCDKLIRAGADMKIRNANRLYIATDSESDIVGRSTVSTTAAVVAIAKPPEAPVLGMGAVPSVFLKKPELSPTTPSEDTINKEVNKIVGMLLQVGKPPASEVSATQDNLPDALTVTEGRTNGNSNGRNQSADIYNTSDFVDNLIKEYGTGHNAQVGGKKYNTRQMKTYSDVQFTGGSPSSDSDELSRLVNNQASEIHDRTVKRIMELLGADMVTAKAFKALLYKKTQKEKPELNNYDRAVEMEKLATLEELEKIKKDQKSAVEEIKQHISEKEKQRAETPMGEKKPKKEKSEAKPATKEKKTKKKKSDESATSSELVPTESNFSATSADQI